MSKKSIIFVQKFKCQIDMKKNLTQVEVRSTKKLESIKGIQALELDEMNNIQGGCWFCRAWNWLKKNFTPSTEMIRDAEGNEIGRVYGGTFSF